MQARVDHSRYLALARPPAFARRTSRGKRCSDGREPTDIYLLNRFRSRQRRHAADGRCAGWKRRRRWYQEVVTLPRRRTIRIRAGIARHANACKGVDVGVRSREAVRKRLEEGHDLVLLRIAQP